MFEVLRALKHCEVEECDDESLRREAFAHLAQNPPLQLVAELVQKLRAFELPWWSAEFARATWPAAVRMRWLKGRPDLRQSITTRLTGLSANAARRFWPDDQAALIDAVIDTGDLDVAAFDGAFDPFDMVVYGGAAPFWAQFRERMAWEETTPVHQKLIAWLLRALLTDRSSMDGLSRKPILAPLDVRSSIDVRAWQASIPYELRVELDEARIKQERSRPRDTFGARSELSIVTPEKLTAHLPLRELLPVIDRAEQALGFSEPPVPMQSAPPGSDGSRPSQTN